MNTATFLVILINVFIFSSSLILNVLFQGYAAYIRIILIIALWLFTIYLLSTTNSLRKHDLRLPNYGLLLLLMCSTIMLIVSATVSEAPLNAIFYSMITYFSFYPLVYLLLVIRQNAILTKKLLIVLVILCNILSIGVIYDGAIGLDNIPFLSNKIVAVLQEIKTVDGTGDQRGGFFFGSATSVYPFLSIGIMSTLLLNKLFIDKKITLLLYFSIPLIWLGCFFSFSRTPIILGTTFAVYAFFDFFCIHKKHKLVQKIILVFTVIFLASIATNIQSLLYEQAGQYHIYRFTHTLSASDPGNSHRFIAWRKGLELFNSLEAWRGYGLGTSNLRMGQIYGFDLKPQYESSILLTFSEGGIAGLFARLFPLLVTLWVCQNTHVRILFSVWSFLFFLNLCVSPLINGHPVQLAYFLGMSMCIAFAPVVKIVNKSEYF